MHSTSREDPADHESPLGHPSRCFTRAVLTGLAFAIATTPAAAPGAAPAPAPKKAPAAPGKKGVKKTRIVDDSPPSSAYPPKRRLPDYDGRGPRATTLGDAALWVPRILVAPAYLTTEYLLRRPLGGLISGVERDHLAQKAVYVFSLGGKDKVGLVPTLYVDFGFLPSVGLYFFWDDAFAKHNHVRLHAGTWGPDWINLAVADRYDVGKNSTAAIRAAWSRRSDYLFYGFGPDSAPENESRYSATTLDVNADYRLELTPGMDLNTTAGLRDTTFAEATCCDDPALQARVRRGELPAPPRLADGYAIGYQRAAISLDSRERRPASQSGVRLALEGEPAFDVSHTPGNAWLRSGAIAGAFFDLTGRARVLSLTLAALFVDPLKGGADQIPFNELISLGGAGLMRGFLAGRLIDRSAAVATLAYQWPIWVFLDGTLQVSAGNVFGAHLRGVDPGKLRLSSGVGLRSNGSADQQFEILVGVGSETFDSGARVSSFRLALGATRGF